DEDDAAALDSIQQLAVLRVGKVAARDVQRGIGSVEGSMPEEEDEHLIVGANGTAELLDVLSDVLGRRGAIHEIAIGQPCLGEYADSIRRKSEAIDEQRARLAQVGREFLCVLRRSAQPADDQGISLRAIRSGATCRSGRLRAGAG